MGFGEMTKDDIGRCFCKDHRREVCNECCLSFDMQNRFAEEAAGLKKPKTEVEKAADEWAMATFSLKGMERMMPRPSEAVFEQKRSFQRVADEKLRRFQQAGEDVQSAMNRALEEQRTQEVDREALVQAWARKNPGKKIFEVGGKETQELYDQFVAQPKAKDNKADKYACNYCGVPVTDNFKLCGRCRKVSYCNRECQTAAWKAHKKECKKLDEVFPDPKTMHLTWAEVEAHQGQLAQGRTLEVRAVLDESVTRQVFTCKDRVGAVRRVAAYTNSRSIPGLKQGSIIRLKNPRFHHFMDGSSGVRIEESDLPNVTIK